MTVCSVTKIAFTRRFGLHCAMGMLLFVCRSRGRIVGDGTATATRETPVSQNTTQGDVLFTKITDAEPT